MIGNYINELKHKMFIQDAVVPPYIRKRNRRMKSIHKSMHDSDSKDAPLFGHIKYHKFLQTNEIPDHEMLNDLLHQSMHKKPKHDRQHYRSGGKHHAHKIKRLRSRLPEAGIMQKKFKPQ